MSQHLCLPSHFQYHHRPPETLLPYSQPRARPLFPPHRHLWPLRSPILPHPHLVSPASLPLSSHHEVTTEVTKAEQPSPGWEGKLRTPRARAPRVSMPRIRQRELDCCLSLGHSGSQHQDNLKFSRLPVGPSHLPFRWGRRGAGDRSDTLGPQSKVESMATKGVFKQRDPEPLVSR